MRHVFSNAEIPHLWAHQRQEHARNSNQSFWFNNGVIYSYREPIGRMINGVALFRLARFSITTSRHQSEMRQAARHLPAFTVRYLRTDFSAEIPHDRNLADFQQRIEIAAVTARRSRKANRDYHLTALTELVDEANRYTKWAGTKRRFEVPPDDFIRQLLADEKAAQQREKQRQAEQAETIRRENAESIAKWISGESVHLPYNLDTAYLRIEGEEVATSKGARVPLEHVLRVLPIVQRLIERGETYQRNGHTIHLGHYALDRIESDGTVWAGCHTVTKAEIQRFIALAAQTSQLEVSR
jgi:hypothetical protein